MTGTGTQAEPYIVSNWTDFITAIGATDAYVEFPKNLVKTSDTEVNPNKLYVDSSGTVQTNVQASDLANLYENTFVLDANDYAPEGLTTTITINCASINGFGGTIRNLASTQVNIFTKNSSSLTLNQLAILNFNVEDHKLFCTDFMEFHYCIFSGRIKSVTVSGLRCFGNDSRSINQEFNSCSMNIVMDGSITPFEHYYMGYNYYGSIFRNCRIELHKTNNNTSGGDMIANSQNSYFTGDIDGNFNVRFTQNSANSIVAIETSDAAFVNSGSVSLILINTDTVTSENIGSNYTQVTTAQLKSAEDLAALGFPIQT